MPNSGQIFIKRILRAVPWDREKTLIREVNNNLNIITSKSIVRDLKTVGSVIVNVYKIMNANFAKCIQ